MKEHGYNNLPSDPVHIALCVTHVIDTQCSPNVIAIANYAKKRVHVLNCLFRSN